MSSKDITSAVIAKFNEKITDEVFLTIQNDAELMGKYLKAVSKDGSDVVNRAIGKAVKAAYGLTDLGECDDPKSTLIKGHTTYQPSN